jgi:hypothetical protein
MNSQQKYRRKRNNPKDILTAQSEAQKIAFSPLLFQAIRTMLELKIFEFLRDDANTRTIKGISEQLLISPYAAGVLMDISVCYELVAELNGEYLLTKVGKCFLEDPLTLVNFNFVSDVCYKAAFHLKDSIKTGKPAGLLNEFGNWNTLYDAFGTLPNNIQTSWLNFDNYYSDISFSECIRIILRDNPNTVYDIGANTGKFGKTLLLKDEKVNLVCIDLPYQLQLARSTIKNSERVSYLELNILEDSPPVGADAVWMSQFLDCFAPAQIINILKKSADALNTGGKIFILEPFIDCQPAHSAALSLACTSLYFTCVANGYSKMYKKEELVECINAAGLKVRAAYANIANIYTLLECERADAVV